MSQARILVVDDDEQLLAGLQRMLSNDFEVTTFSDTPSALNVLANPEIQFAAAVVDYKMPRIDGIEFCSLARELQPDMPCILLSGHIDVECLTKAVNMGRIAYVLSKPCPNDRIQTTVNHMVRYYAKSKTDRDNIMQELGKIEYMLRKFESQMTNTLVRIDKANIDSLSALGLIIAGKSKKLALHGRMTGNLAKGIATEMQLSTLERNTLWWAGVVHEIGQAIAGKTEDVTLTGVQYNEYLHLSFVAVSAVNLTWPIAERIYQHRERLNGTGFPAALKNEEVKFAARILGVADYLVSYAQDGEKFVPYHFDKALENLIEKNEGRFDNDVINACADLCCKKGVNEILCPVYTYN